jgi:sugar phosphate isomerase/epimerase
MRPMAIGVITGGAPQEAIRLIKSLEMECCQLMMPDKAWFDGDGPGRLKEQQRALDVTVVGLFCHFKGESYADIPTIHRTVGLVNPETRAARVAQVLENSDSVAALETPTILAHIGFIPEDRNGADYAGVVDSMRKITGRCAKNNQSFGLETGQESAPALKQFIADVGASNLKVNFDPANMLMYGSGRPLEALDLLKDHLVSVHCKDGRWPAKPGTLGEEAPFGEGEVDVEAFIGRLGEIGFTGPLIIEREISGEQQRRDILRARDLIAGLRAQALQK